MTELEVPATDLDELYEDGVIDLADARDLLPTDAEMTVIDGASHASFGAYGRQPGDGTPTLSAEEAHGEIDSLVVEFLDTLAD